MTDVPSHASRVVGTLRVADGTGVVRIEDCFDTGPPDLWSTLTDAQRLARWLGEFEGELCLGGQFRATFFASGWEGVGRVELCEPPARLRLITSDPDGSDQHIIEATLSADGDQTLLAIEERGIPLAELANYGAGVQIHVEDLSAYLSGHGRCEPRARWQELVPSYQALAEVIG